MSFDEPFDGTIDLTGDGALPRVNGHEHTSGLAAEAPRVSRSELDDVPWYPSYDRASVEAYLTSLDEERARLEADIADAEHRTAAAQDALAASTTAPRPASSSAALAASASWAAAVRCSASAMSASSRARSSSSDVR